MIENNQNYLFGSLNNTYEEARKEFDSKRGFERSRSLVAIINNAIDNSVHITSDETRVERGTYVDDDTVTITAASLKFDGLIEAGETAVTKGTDWLPRGSREVNGKNLRFQVRFQRTNFARLQEQEPHFRFGPIMVEGQLIDADGVTADFPIANFFVDKEIGEYKLFYNFGSEIPPSSNDFSEIEKVIKFFNEDETHSKKEFTVREIAIAVTRARHEITGIETDQHDQTFGNSKIRGRLVSAQQKAMRKAGDSWTQRSLGGPLEIEYDSEHVNRILDAFADTARRSRRLNYKALGINETVIKRTRELLYGTIQ